MNKQWFVKGTVLFFTIIILVLLSISVLAQSEPAAPTVPEEFVDTFSTYEEYYDSSYYYGILSTDMSNYDFTSFDDWDNLNLNNPSLDLNTLDNDKFKNILNRDDWMGFDNVIDNFNSRVSESPAYVNGDADLMNTWLGSFSAGYESEGAIGLKCLGSCMIRSFNKDTGEVITLNTKNVEDYVALYNAGEITEQELEERLVSAEALSFNIKDPIFDGALVDKYGQVCFKAGACVASGDITTEETSTGESQAVVIGGLVTLDGTETKPIKMVGGNLKSNSLNLWSADEKIPSTFVFSDGKLIVEELGSGGVVGNFIHPETREAINFRGSVTSITFDEDQVAISTPPGEKFSFMGYNFDTGEDVFQLSIEGYVNLDLNDVNRFDDDSDDFLNHLTLHCSDDSCSEHEKTVLFDLQKGHIVSVNEETGISYKQEGCLAIDNCVEYYIDEELGSVMTASTSNSNEMKIVLANLEVDKPLGTFRVKKIDSECDGCYVTLTDNGRAKILFSEFSPYSQGNLAELTVGSIESEYESHRFVSVDGEFQDQYEEHDLFIRDGLFVVCSEPCDAVGAVYSEDIDVSIEEIYQEAYLRAVRIAQNPSYTSEWGSYGSMVYGQSRNMLQEGEKMSVSQYFATYHGGSDDPLYAYDCIGLTRKVYHDSTGNERSWRQIYDMKSFHEKLRTYDEDLKTECLVYVPPEEVARGEDGSKYVPGIFTNNPNIEVKYFYSEEELEDYASDKPAGAPVSFFTDYGSGGHEAIKGNGLDTIECKPNSNRCSVEEDRISDFHNSFRGFLVTTPGEPSSDALAELD